MKGHSMFADPTVCTTLPSLIKIKVGMARTLYFCAMSAHLSVSTLTKATVDGGKHGSVCSLVVSIITMWVLETYLSQCLTNAENDAY